MKDAQTMSRREEFVLSMVERLVAKQGANIEPRKVVIVVVGMKHKGYNLYSHEGCTSKAKVGGVCIKHGAVVKSKTCKEEGCTNIVVQGGVCTKHGANRTVKTCSHEGCTNLPIRHINCKRLNHSWPSRAKEG